MRSSYTESESGSSAREKNGWLSLSKASIEKENVCQCWLKTRRGLENEENIGEMQ